MQEWPADACSGKWYDEDNRLLGAVFAFQVRMMSEGSVGLSKNSIVSGSVPEIETTT